MQWNVLYDLYERRLRRSLDSARIPKHVGVILDGNRRWAKAVGTAPAEGHRAGGDLIGQFLEWADEVGVSVVTLWLLSTDNLSREKGELDELLEIIASTVESLASSGKWRIKIVGDLSPMAPELTERLTSAAAATAGAKGMEVNVAVGYGGRQELVDAVRELLKEAASDGRTLAEVADELDDAQITEHLYTRGQPDPDLIIRTSGEQRLSGFMLWQSAHSEYYFCEAYWPDFRRVDFLRALRSYAQRERRRGL